MSIEPNALADYALRLGDDSLILGQRLGEWCGHSPAIELDLSLTNLALDLIGQAQLFLAYAGQCEGQGRDADRLAFHRDVLDYKNCLLVEQPNGDFAHTIARQFFFSTWQELLLRGLCGSTDATLSAVAAKAVKEVAYHARFAADWVVRLGDGTAESHDRMVAGLAWMWRFVGELFHDEPVDAGLIAGGVAVDRAALRGPWDERIGAVLSQAGLSMPARVRDTVGGRRGHHTEHLGHLLAVMQHLPRTYPDAQW